MNLFAIIANLRFQDVLDILFLTVVAYHLYLWFRGTKAFKALVGLLALGAVYTIANTWGLFLTTWVFQIFWQVLVILLIILFQSEIRQVLEKVNPLQALGIRRNPVAGEWIPDLSKGVFALAERVTGALIIIEGDDRISELITGDQSLDGEAKTEFLLTVFNKESPVHDGAMLLRKGRIAKVTCYLPLTSSEGLPSNWGTRHRAALGLTEKCDAIVVVVSEERGEVSVAKDREMTPIETPEALSQFLIKAATRVSPEQVNWKSKVKFFILRRWQAKIGTLALVCLMWLLLAGQQDFERTLSIPLELKNIPPGTTLIEPLDPRVKIIVRGLRKDVSTLDEKNVRALLSLSTAERGESTFPVTRGNISLPNERIQIVDILPSRIDFQFKKNGSSPN